LRQRRPAHGHDGAGHRRAHQGDGLAEQEDLGLVARAGERVGVQEREGGLGRIVRAPRALDQDSHAHRRWPDCTPARREGQGRGPGPVRPGPRCYTRHGGRCEQRSPHRTGGTMSTVTRLSANRPEGSAEWQLRVDLAAAFRMAVELGWHEAVANHFSLAVTADGKKFLMNPRWRHFGRIKASELLLLDATDPETMRRPDAPDAS